MNFLKYSLLRFGLMIVVFLLCMWLNVGLILSGVFAILIAFAVSYLAFPKLHVAAGQDMQRWFSKHRKDTPQKKAVAEDTEIEDEYAEQKRREEGIDF